MKLLKSRRRPADADDMTNLRTLIATDTSFDTVPDSYTVTAADKAERGWTNIDNRIACIPDAPRRGRQFRAEAPAPEPVVTFEAKYPVRGLDGAPESTDSLRPLLFTMLPEVRT